MAVPSSELQRFQIIVVGNTGFHSMPTSISSLAALFLVGWGRGAGTWVCFPESQGVVIPSAEGPEVATKQRDP